MKPFLKTSTTDWLFLIILLIFLIFLIYQQNFIPYFRNLRYINQARQSCEILAKAIQDHNSSEKTVIKDKDFKDLKGKYLKGLDTIKDPWGRRYRQNTDKRIVYSPGPDEIEGTNDDIIVYY